MASPQTLGVPPLTATVSKRTIEGNGSEGSPATFKKNVDTNLTHYTGTVARQSDAEPDASAVSSTRQEHHWRRAGASRPSPLGGATSRKDVPGVSPRRTTY